MRTDGCHCWWISSCISFHVKFSDSIMNGDPQNCSFDFMRSIVWSEYEEYAGLSTLCINSAVYVTLQTYTSWPVLAVTRAESPNSVAGSGSPCSAHPLHWLRPLHRLRPSHRLRPHGPSLIGVSCVRPLTWGRGDRASSSCSMVDGVWGVESFSPAGQIDNTQSFTCTLLMRLIFTSCKCNTFI